MNDVRKYHSRATLCAAVLLVLAQGIAAQPTPVDLPGLDTLTTGYILNGGLADEKAGFSMHHAGDINSNGYRDTVIGAPEASPDPSRIMAGKVYVVFGSWSGSLPNNTNISALDGTNGFVIYGEAAGDKFGFSVSGVGDFNHDNCEDLIVGAPYATANGHTNVGKVYILFGQRITWPAVIEASTLSPYTSPPTGIIIPGEADNDNCGWSVSHVGDINYDNIPEILLGAPGARGDLGKAYIIFSKWYGSWNSPLNLTALGGTVTEPKGVAFLGVLPGGRAGSTVTYSETLQFIRTDILISAPLASPGTPSRSQAGAVHVVFGRRGTWPATIDLATLDGTNGFTIEGTAASDQAGTIVSRAGDVNGDVREDFVITTSTGSVYVAFGQNNSNWPTSIDLSTIGASVPGFTIVTGDTSPTPGLSVSDTGDWTGDGVADILVGIPNLDKAYMVLGHPGTWPSSVDPATLPDNAAAVFFGPPGSRIGEVVAYAGEINNDGVGDILIGSYSYNSGAGKAYLVYGDSTLLNLDMNWVNITAQGTVNITTDNIHVSGGGIHFTPWQVQLRWIGGGNGQFEKTTYPGVAITRFTYQEILDGLIVYVSTSFCKPNFGLDMSYGVHTGARTLMGTVYWTPAPNQVPVITMNSMSISEGGSVPLYSLEATDADLCGGVLTFTVQSVTHGNCVMEGVNVTQFTLNQASYRLVTFVHDGSKVAPTLVLTVSDGTDSSPPSTCDIKFNIRQRPLPSLKGASTGFALNGEQENDNMGQSVHHAGDINGDGHADVVFSAQKANPDPSRYMAGKAYVLFGKPSGSVFPDIINVSTLDGNNGFAINGNSAYDGLGYSVSAAGDLNGDGLSDVVLSATGASPPGLSSAGIMYIVFGRTGAWPAAINVSDLSPSTTPPSGLVIYGADLYVSCGWSVTHADDFNADGFTDIAVSAPNANSYRGKVYVIFGHDGAWDSPIDLTALGGSETSPKGVVFLGAFSNGETGKSLSAVDMNSDGVADLIISSYGASPGTPPRGQAGAVYVVFGHAGAWPASFDLATLNGTNGFILGGAAAGERAGASVSRAGDVNGDNMDDLVFTNAWQPKARVVFGQSSSYTWPALVDLSTLVNSTGFSIVGSWGETSGQWAVGDAGDWDGDGIGDILVGTNVAYVVLGHSGAWDTSLDITMLTDATGAAYSYPPGTKAQSLSRAGDINGDGADDIVIGAAGYSNGQTFVVYGFGQQPVIDENTLSISANEMVNVTTDNIHVTGGPLMTPAQVVLTPTGLTNGHFEGANAPGVAITSFTYKDVIDGAIVIVSTSSCPPVYSLALRYGSITSPSSPATVSWSGYNQVPSITVNFLDIAEGGTVTLDGSMLQATDADLCVGVLTFAVQSVTHGVYHMGGLNVTHFTVDNVAQGHVSFVHDGGEDPPSIVLTVSDGTDSSAPSTCNVSFTDTNDAPVENVAISTQGGCCSAVVGAEFVFVFSSSTFLDPDGDSLTLTTTALPLWLLFDPVARKFQGTPTSVDNLTVTVTATDPSGASCVSTFTLSIALAPVFSSSSSVGAISSSISSSSNTLSSSSATISASSTTSSASSSSSVGQSSSTSSQSSSSQASSSSTPSSSAGNSSGSSGSSSSSPSQSSGVSGSSSSSSLSSAGTTLSSIASSQDSLSSSSNNSQVEEAETCGHKVTEESCTGASGLSCYWCSGGCQDTDCNALSAGAIAGIVIGVLAGVAVIGAGIGVGVYVAAQAAATAGENIALTTGVEIPQLTGIPATNPPPPSAV